MTLRVIPDGERRYRLLDAQGREVGWIRGRAVRFHGFASESAVMHAAEQAWRALRNVLERGINADPHRLAERHLRLVHDGAYEWISDGVLPMARLYRPRADERDASFSIELVVPSYADDDIAISAARAIADAVRAHAGDDDVEPAALAGCGD